MEAIIDANTAAVSCAVICIHGDEHAEVAAKHRGKCTDKEGASSKRLIVFFRGKVDKNSKKNAEDCEVEVLLLQENDCSGLNATCNLLHEKEAILRRLWDLIGIFACFSIRAVLG